LPFEGGAKDADYSMVFVLPPENGPADLSADLFAELDAWLEGPEQEQFVLISLPKIDTAVSTSFNQLLIGLGMPTAFTQGAAAFSAMTPEQVFISKVFHKATLTMNEQGTTAAAATEIDFAICFAAGTPVLTPQGARPIEELKPGDLVLARDENNVEGQPQFKRVEKLHHNESEILELLVQGRLIRTTQTHPFFVKGKGWLPAGELLPRDLLSTSAGDWVVVNAVQRTQTIESVYNLRVADCHTYFVGEESWGFAVWVHNSCSGEEPTFFADRPFHLFIRDNITSTIAFMGRIDDPRQLQNDVTPAVADANADFDGNLTVDGADFLAWQRGLGMTGDAHRSDGDSNADGDVDSSDLTDWMRTYGQSVSLLEAADAPVEGPHSASLRPRETASTPELVDAAMAIEWLAPENEGEEPSMIDEQELMLLSTKTRTVDGERIPTAAAAVVFESLALDSIGEQFAVDIELDDEPLASLFE
jgi:hypothetical protein